MRPRDEGQAGGPERGLAWEKMRKKYNLIKENEEEERGKFDSGDDSLVQLSSVLS